MTLIRSLSILLACTALFFFSTAAFAATAGTVTHVSGPLAARKGDGKIKTLAINSVVESGDTLITEKRTYARIKFIDNSEVTLKPNTQFKVEEFGYNKDKPGEDKAVYNLVKGGLRAVTGQIGKRNDPDSYRMKTPTATIGVRGTIYTADYIEDEQQAESAPVLVALAETETMTDAVPILVARAPGLPHGTYVTVIEGAVDLVTGAGRRTFTAGQHAHARDNHTLPNILLHNPGFQFTPPPGFSRPGTGSHAPASGAHEGCEVH